jgi:hypothetical protein
VEEEVEGMGEEDLEKHRVVEESIESTRREEEEVHRAVEDSFESLREDRVCVWLKAKNKGMKAATTLQIPGSRFDDVICEAWMSAAARRKAAGKLRQRPRCWAATTILSARGQRSTMQIHQAALPQAPGGGHVLNNAEALSSSVSSESGPVTDVSSGDEGDV